MRQVAVWTVALIALASGAASAQPIPLPGLRVVTSNDSLEGSGTIAAPLKVRVCTVGFGLVSDGTSWDCAAIAGGDITGVAAGSGLTGGGTSGDVTLNVIGTTGGGLTVAADSVGLLTTCASTQGLAWNGTAWACANLPSGTGGTNKATKWATSNTLTDGFAIDNGVFWGQVGIFGIATATGDTAVGGTLDVVGNFSVNTNKMTVNATSGNTVIAGTGQVTGTLNSTGNLSENTVRVATVAGAGMTKTGGTFDVIGTTGGGLTVAADSVGLLTSCSADQVLAWVGSAWTCSTVTTLSGVGDITDVVAGAGLTGGGSSGSVTLDVACATGMTCSANQIEITSRDFGDITTSSTGSVWTIDNDVVTYAKMQNISATSRFLGRITGGAGDTEELTGTQATTLLDVFATAATTKGVVPGSNGGGATVFLDGTGAWSTPSGAGDITAVTAGAGLTGGATSGAATLDVACLTGLGCNADSIQIADRDFGDITTTSSGSVWTIDANVVTYAKMQDVSATSRFLGRITAGAGDTEELTGTQATTLLTQASTSTTTQGVVPGSNGGGATVFLNGNLGWTTPTGLISGLTANYVTRASSATAIQNGTIKDDGTSVTFNTTAGGSTAKVTITSASGNTDIQGTLGVTGLVTATAGGTTPANWTTTGTGDLVSGDDLTVADDATITDRLDVSGAAFVAKGTGGTALLNIGDDTALTTNTKVGWSVTPYSPNGNNYIDSKTFTGGSTVWRTGEGAASGQGVTWLTVTSATGATNFGGALVASSTVDVVGVLTAAGPTTLGDSGTGDKVLIKGGEFVDGGTVPSSGTCGTSPSWAGGRNFWHVTAGTGAPTSCATTFSTAYSASPTCTVTVQGVAKFAYITALSASAITFQHTDGSSMQGFTYHVSCVGDG